MIQRVDYDEIAPHFDERYDGEASENRGIALGKIAQRNGAMRILEVGCGTGHWLARLDSGDRKLYGLDPSTGMLAEAQKKFPHLELARSNAKSLPYQSASFDFVYCTDAIHHFENVGTFISESSRILKEHGSLAILGGDPHIRQHTWFVNEYFDGVYERDISRFPKHEDLIEWMKSAGFKDLSRFEVDRIDDSRKGREVLDHPFIKKNSCSQLAQLSQEAYAEGVERIKAALAKAEGEGVELDFESVWTIYAITGTKA